MKQTELTVGLVPSNLTVAERQPILLEIIRKAEHLQIRAVAVLYADAQWKEDKGTWTGFCRSQFGWDDSYASRMKHAAQMVIEGSTITTEAQARALTAVEPSQRSAVLDAAREKSGREPTASDISREASVSDEDGVLSSSTCQAAGVTMDDAANSIDDLVGRLRTVLRDAKALAKDGAGRWVNLPHLITDLKNAADALKHARPYGDCDEGGEHDANCLCGGTGWLPQHVLERPRK